MNSSDRELSSKLNERFAGLIDLDWADKKHAVAFLVAGSQIPEHMILEHTS